MGQLCSSVSSSNISNSNSNGLKLLGRHRRGASDCDLKYQSTGWDSEAAEEDELKEARMQVDVLQAEVNALKTLVITSTPSQPNAHLHPQLCSSVSSSNISNSNSNGLKLLGRHRRGASDCDLKYQSTGW